MKDLQNNLKKLISQYEFFGKFPYLDIVLMCIYPIYRLLAICQLEFVSHFYRYSTLFLLIFVAGAVLAFANNKIKEMIIAFGVLEIFEIVSIFSGNFEEIIFFAIYGAIIYGLYKFSGGDIFANAPKKCPRCGKPVENDAKFCTGCGDKLQ